MAYDMGVGPLHDACLRLLDFALPLFAGPLPLDAAFAVVGAATGAAVPPLPPPEGAAADVLPDKVDIWDVIWMTLTMVQIDACTV